MFGCEGNSGCGAGLWRWSFPFRPILFPTAAWHRPASLHRPPGVGLGLPSSFPAPVQSSSCSPVAAIGFFWPAEGQSREGIALV